MKKTYGIDRANRLFFPEDKDHPAYVAAGQVPGMAGWPTGTMRWWEHAHGLVVLADFLATGPLRVLSIGAHWCHLSEALHLAGHDVLGVDPDPETAEWAEQSGLPVEIAHVQDLDLAPASFDLVVSVSTFEHMPRNGDRRAAEVVARVTKPGGMIYITSEFGVAPVSWNREVVGGRIYDTATACLRVAVPAHMQFVDAPVWTSKNFPDYRGTGAHFLSGAMVGQRT